MGFDLTGIGALGDVAGKLIDRFIPNPQEKAKAVMELEQMKQNGELARMANEADLFKAEVEDRKSARTIHTNFVDFLAISCLVGSIYILYQILFKGLAPNLPEMTAGMIIGMIVSIVPQILNYYFGSSSSSKMKNDAINSALKKV